MAPPARHPSPTFPLDTDAEFHEQAARHKACQAVIWAGTKNGAALRAAGPSPPLPILGLTPLGRTRGATARAHTTGTTSRAPLALAPFRGQCSPAVNRRAVSLPGWPLADPVPHRAASPSGGDSPNALSTVASPSGGDSPSAQPRATSPSGGDSQPGGAPALDPFPPVATADPDKANVVPLGPNVVSPSSAAIAQASDLMEKALQTHADTGTWCKPFCST
jgi:hypothetical protein